MPDIADEYGTTNALIGGVLTGMWLAYALTQFPSGMLADPVRRPTPDRSLDRWDRRLGPGAGSRAGVLAVRGRCCLLGRCGEVPLQRRHRSAHAHLRRHRNRDRDPQRGGSGRAVRVPTPSSTARSGSATAEPGSPFILRAATLGGGHTSTKCERGPRGPDRNTTPGDSKSAGPCATIRRSPGSLPPY